MRIVILGSSQFRKEKVKIRDDLKALGHDAIIDNYTERLAKGELGELLQRMKTEHAQVKRDYNLMEWYFNAIRDSDAVLVVNLEKNGIKDYIGANSFLELGYANALKKKVYAWNPLPEMKYINDEIHAMDIVIIGQDLSLIH